MTQLQTGAEGATIENINLGAGTSLPPPAEIEVPPAEEMAGTGTLEEEPPAETMEEEALRLEAERQAETQAKRSAKVDEVSTTIGTAATEARNATAALKAGLEAILFLAQNARGKVLALQEVIMAASGVEELDGEITDVLDRSAQVLGQFATLASAVETIDNQLGETTDGVEVAVRGINSTIDQSSAYSSLEAFEAGEDDEG